MKYNWPETRIHIPIPSTRPGDIPDFSNIKVPAVDECRRPDIETPAHEMDDLAYGLVRVLGEDHKAAGEWAVDIDPQVLCNGLSHMLQMRLFDDRMFTLQRQGKLSFYLKCAGEEVVAVAAAYALRTGDMLFPSYRQFLRYH